MNWRIVVVNLTCFCGAYWLFLSITKPSGDCFWFLPAAYGSFAIAVICYLAYTYKFYRQSQARWIQLIHLILAGILFFFIWSVGTITSIRIAMDLACPNALFSAHTSGTQFDRYKDIPFFLVLFLPVFVLSILINLLLQAKKNS